MDVIDEIVKWALSQPLWQQLLVADLLSGASLDDAKAKKFADQAIEWAQDPEAYKKKVGDPLKNYKYSSKNVGDGVRVTEVIATQNINAIADNSSLPLQKTGLNVIYGDNASGKSGYTRILKNCCNCRHSETLKGNVDGEHDKECIAHVSYEVDGKADNYRLDEFSEPNIDLKTVHVFDSKSGRNYLVSENNIVFMPSGMDVLDALSSALEKISQHLKGSLSAAEQSLNDLTPSFSEYEGTKAHTLINNLHKSDAMASLDKLKVLTLNEESQHTTLKEEIILRQAKSPQKIRDEKEKLCIRLSGLLSKVVKLRDSLEPKSIDELIEKRDHARNLRKIADEAGRKRFESNDFIKGTGNELWKTLWEAAKEFSQNAAYKGHVFPRTENDAKCVLCQQKLDEPAKKKFSDFVSYVKDRSQSEAIAAETELKTRTDSFTESNLTDDYVDQLLVNFSKDDYKDIGKLAKEITQARVAHKFYLSKIGDNTKISKYKDITGFKQAADNLEKYVKGLKQELSKPLDDEEFRIQLQKDIDVLNDLKSRKALKAHQKNISENISTHLKIGILNKAMRSSGTFAVSSKIGDISGKLIIGKLAKTFNEELNEMFRGKITAHLEKGKTVKGVPSSLIVLRGKSGDFKGDSLEKIMSEGEQKGVSLAGFFTELTITPSNSAIVLDDPVTSLDHLNIEKIAKRIAEESLKRQVIVFTHNILLVSELERAVEGVGGEYNARSIEKLSTPGIVRDILPFDTMKTGQRIDFLEKRVGSLKTMYDTNDKNYATESRNFYKDLRITWERAIEELLFNGSVERYRRDVHPARVMQVSITEEDKQIIGENMEICGKFLHDPANKTPDPTDIQKDLKTIKDWVKKIKERRKDTKK